MTQPNNNTMTLRLRQSKAILIALAQGSLPWAALTVAFFCILLFVGSYFMTSEYIPIETKGMMLRLFSPMMFALGCIGVIVALIFTHSALDEMRSQFPSYELMFPVPIWLSATLHLVYKLLVWGIAYHILYWSSKYVVAGFIVNFSNLFEKIAPEFIFASLVFLMFQQIAWLQHNTYRIFWMAIHLVILIRWYAWKELDLMYFQIGYLLVLCYAQVYLQRRGGFAFDIVDAISRINLGEDTERKLSPLRATMEIQWKAWYRWIFAFNMVLSLPVLLIYGLTSASLVVSGVIYIFLGYMTERRDTNSMFCSTRPVKDRLLCLARHMNAFRCAAITLLLILGLDLMMDWLRFLSGSEHVYYSSDELKLRYLYERYMNTDAKAAIVILYLSIYAITLIGLWFTLVAGRFLILLTVFVGCASMIASVVYAPVAIYLNTLNLDIPLLIFLYTLQSSVAVLALWDRDMWVLRRFTNKAWIARVISAGLIASLGVLGIIVFQNYALVAFYGSFVMLAILAAKQMGTLEKRDAVLLAFAALCAILAPLPVVLSFTDELAQDWIAWSAVLFTALALPLLCVPITIRWQRVLG